MANADLWTAGAAGEGHCGLTVCRLTGRCSGRPSASQAWPAVEPQGAADLQIVRSIGQELYLRTLVFLMISFLACAAFSCGEAVQPPIGITPTLDNLWPTDDGRGWSYAVVERRWEPEEFVFSDSSAVPPPPDLPTLLEWLGTPRYPATFDEYSHSYSLTFAGVGTTESGAIGQLLESQSDRDHGHDQVGAAITPFLLHDGIWRKTTEWMGRFSDLTDVLTWKVLVSDLSPGVSFNHPTLGSAVLRGWILEEIDAITPVGTFPGSLRCVYLMYTPPTGGSTVFHPEGWRRHFYLGEIIFAPTVGPVYAYERHAASSGDTNALGVGEIRLSLVGLHAQ